VALSAAQRWNRLQRPNLDHMVNSSTDRRPEWLVRKHGKQRSEPYAELLTQAQRCTAVGDTGHQRSIVITTVHDLDGNELPIADENEARNVRNALYRSRPRGPKNEWLVSLPKPEMIQHPDGTWEIRCCVHDKAAGDAFIAANPHHKVYDPAERTAAAATRGPARRRRPTKREADAAARRELDRRHYEEQLETAPVGGDMDMRIFQIDYGYLEPASPAEKRRKTRVDAALASRPKQAPARKPEKAPTAADRLRAILKG
jgi:hypothetical protein